MRKLFIITVTATILAVAAPVSGDVIELNNGDIIDGEKIRDNPEEDFIIVEVMGKGFKKESVKIKRSEMADFENTGDEKHDNFVVNMLQGLENPQGIKTLFFIFLLPVVLPFIALLFFSAVMKHDLDEFWKSIVISAAGWYLPLVLIAFLYSPLRKPALWIGVLALLAVAFVGPLFLYREKPARAAAFTGVYVVSFAVALLLVKTFL